MSTTLYRRPGVAELHPVRTRRRWNATKVVLGVSVPVGFVVLWQLSAVLEWVDPFLYPPPSRLIPGLVALWEDGKLVEATVTSVRRVILGYLLGAAGGLVVGLLMGMSRVLRAALEPFSWAWYTVPKLALLPIFLTIFGFGDTSVVVLIAATVYFFVWISVMSAVMAVPTGYREAALMLRANRWEMFRHVLLPAALPEIFVGLRISAGVSVLMLVGIEFVISDQGLGYLIEQGRTLLLLEQSYVGIVLVALIGYLFALLVKAIGRLFIRWTSDDNAIIPT
ncbi:MULTISPECIES: ABC transporter permease [Nonomuraea]|uniref:ABC transporter permease n=2 Tax=Nonomuraea TaxID=83681 RepID=A0ABW1C2R5_9ACTN|nr:MULTISPECIES: ABC transporter permease [Nonomuraea]MDA0644123.1 ABC transporter permease [Nonomuraea ferruginea]TXK40338.1 ABC transporter permease [Nonomuraea sp. C10]